MINKIVIIVWGIIFNGIIPYSIHAQFKNTNQISLGYGDGDTNQTFILFDDVLPNMVTDIEYGNYKTTGAINLRYKHAIRDQLTVSGILVYESISEIVISNKNKIGSKKHSMYTIGIETDYYYILKKWFQMYTGLGVAYSTNNQKFESYTTSYSNDKRNNSIINYQLIAAGIRVGTSIAGYAELGFGYKGIINFGVSYQFM
ncbi:hypothetical protein [Aquimarina longa]|uniref:hypothetical protein n=1 Tax=Aquimarina longa TaxID=1080221 RepID=UPI000784D7B8|nr:hypothetical protein [Aquimarina longa]